MDPLDWQRVRVVVFDVDGTLYDQRCLRWRMLPALAGHCLLRPRRIEVLRVIARFRRERERLADQEATEIGRRQLEIPARALGVSPERIREVVREWMEVRPLRYLGRCRFPRVERVFARLAESGRTVGILSDYPAAAKLEALGLQADIVVSALDPEVDRLKPNPAGLARVLELAGVGPEECLVIGDRDSRDGECARRLGSPFLLKARRVSPRAFVDYRELLADLGA